MRAKKDMRPAQERAATRFYESDAVQAVMPMGSGKTAAAMTALRELIDDGHVRKAIVLAPKRVAQLVWTKEHLLWEHLKDFKVTLVAGNAFQRQEKLSADAEILIVGIDNTQWLVDLLKKAPPTSPLFDCLIIDESSRFKNPRGKRGRALQKIAKRFKIKWELTGTPRPNGYEDQFRPMQLLSNETLWSRSFDSWRSRHFMKVDAKGEPSEYGRDWEIRPEHQKQLLADIQSRSFTMADADLPHMEPIIPVFHWVDLPPEARMTYKQMEVLLLAQFPDKTVLAANAAVAAGKLAQAANGFMYNEEGNVEWIHPEKIDTLLELTDSLDSDHALICYEFREDLRRIRETYRGLPYIGAGVKDADVERFEREWNERKLPLMAIHPASAGHGLNLQHGGSQFLIYSMPWSAENYDQMLKRIHRPGQTKQVYAHHILARDTVDEVKYDRVIMKMNAQEAFRKYLEKI